MKTPLSCALLPSGALLIACSSHEERCEGLARRKGNWTPSAVVLFHYDDENPKREQRHKSLLKAFGACEPISLQFTEGDPAKSVSDNVAVLDQLLAENASRPLVLDMSVFTKRHLLMTLRWLDDRGCWERLHVIYSEPEDYVVSEHVPLSFGIAAIHQIPGFCATPDISRPLHLVVFLGYEGDRALAVYEYIQPMITTLMIACPPYRPEWEGRTENFNRDIIKLVGQDNVLRVDAVDPVASAGAMAQCFRDGTGRAPHGKIICPLGTKPQALGVYLFVRDCLEPPAIVYASPMRHNHEFYSKGIGTTWVLKQP